MSPWESFFSCRISRRRSPIIMEHYCISVWLEQVLHTQPRTRGKIEVCATRTREPDPGSPDRDASTTINFKREVAHNRNRPLLLLSSNPNYSRCWIDSFASIYLKNGYFTAGAETSGKA